MLEIVKTQVDMVTSNTYNHIQILTFLHSLTKSILGKHLLEESTVLGSVEMAVDTLN